MRKKKENLFRCKSYLKNNLPKKKLKIKLQKEVRKNTPPPKSQF
jgi:hypothetical protein